jgi:hypothetical protein
MFYAPLPDFGSAVGSGGGSEALLANPGGNGRFSEVD